MGLTARITSLIMVRPTSESISRRRTFSIAQSRADYRDAQTQFTLLMTQLHEEGFTGSLNLHFSNGRVCNVETIESQKLT